MEVCRNDINFGAASDARIGVGSTRPNRLGRRLSTAAQFPWPPGTGRIPATVASCDSGALLRRAQVAAEHALTQELGVIGAAALVGGGRAEALASNSVGVG